MDPEMEIMFFWTCIHHIMAIVLNITSILIFTCSWKRIGKADELKLSYSVSLLLSILNILSIILVELPRLYWKWTNMSVIFGVRLCHYFWIATPVIESFQIIIFCGLIFGIWSKQNKLRNYSTYRPGVSQLFSFVGIVASSLGILGLMTTSRLYQPQIGRSGTLQELAILEVTCPSETPTLWNITFRWGLGLIVPVLFIAILVTILLLKFWPKCGYAVKSYIKLIASVTFVDFLLQIPAMICHIFYLMNSEYRMNLPDDINTMSFYLYVVSQILPKIQFSSFPIGVITILPWRKNWKLQKETWNNKQSQKKIGNEDVELLPINLPTHHLDLQK